MAEVWGAPVDDLHVFTAISALDPLHDCHITPDTAGHPSQRRTASKKPQLHRPKALLMVASQEARSTTSA